MKHLTTLLAAILLMGAAFAAPIATIPADTSVGAAAIYATPVTGGVLYTTRTTDRTGQTPATASAFVASSAVVSGQAPTALTTAGAGTLTAAALLGGVIVRSGPTADFTDTTSTAALLQAAWTGTVGSSFEWVYRNTTQYAATLAAGSGVTLSGPVIIPPNSAARFLAVWTGVNTVTITAENSGLVTLPNAKVETLNATTGSLAAGKITGTKHVVLITTNAVPGAQLVRSAAAMLGDIPNGAAGYSWTFRIANSGAGTLTLTADSGATVTLTGTMTVAQNTYRDFVAVLTTATTATITSVGSGTYD